MRSNKDLGQKQLKWQSGGENELYSRDGPTSLIDWCKEESKLILGFGDSGVLKTLPGMGTVES